MKQKKKKSVGRLNTITSCISTAMVLLLLGSATFFIQLAHNFGNQLRENFTVEVLLNDGVKDAELDAMKEKLEALPYVKEAVYISKEESTAELAKALEGSPQDFLGFSPIPAEFELFLKAEYANEDSLLQHVPNLYNYEHVNDVIYPKDALAFIDHVIPTIGTVFVAVAALLAFISFSLIHNTIRMSIYARRFSIQTMKLVGARWHYIRLPFLIRAAGVGLVAGFVACLILGCGIYALCSTDAYFSTLITPNVVVCTLGVCMVCGLLLTVLCTYVSVNKFLRMTTAEMFLK